MVYNILSCGGWEATAGSFVGSGSCIKARIGVVILFFIIVMIRKWGAEELDINFSLIFSIIAGAITYLIVVTITGSFRWALGLSTIIAVLVGYGSGAMGLGESDGGY